MTDITQSLHWTKIKNSLLDYETTLQIKNINIHIIYKLSDMNHKYYVIKAKNTINNHTYKTTTLSTLNCELNDALERTINQLS